MERICEPMDKNRIEGVAEQGERARNRKALVIKAQAAEIRRLCSEGERSYLGRFRLVPERATVLSRSEKSAEVVVVASLERRAEGVGKEVLWLSEMDSLRCSRKRSSPKRG